MLRGVSFAIISVIGASYAVWRYTFTGGANTIATGSVSLSLLESTDVINITNALPTSDASGMALGSDQSFDFAVTTYASGNPGDITYSLNISKVTIDSGYTVLPDNGVKVYLTALTDGGEVQVVKPTLVSNIITSGSTGLLTFDSGKTNYLTHDHDTGDTTKTTKYRLRMWIDQTVDSTSWNENTKNQYKLKIGVGENHEQTTLSNSVYSWSEDSIYLGDTIESINGYTTDYTMLGKNYFLKHNIGSDNTVESQEVCYLLNDVQYCLKGGLADYYEENVNTLYASFGEDNCSVKSSSVDCSVSGLSAYATDNGTVNAYAGSLNCGVVSTGDAHCNTDSGGSEK